MFKKKATEFYVQIYKADLKTPINKSLTEKLKCFKEYFYVYHDDASEPHYHVYVRFEKQTTKKEVQKILQNINCFVSDMPKTETLLSTLYYFTNGFRLPVETNYNVKTTK